MATAKDFRAVLLACAKEATEESTDREQRAVNFVARLCGSMAAHGEDVVDAALWNMLDMNRPPLSHRMDGA